VAGSQADRSGPILKMITEQSGTSRCADSPSCRGCAAVIELLLAQIACVYLIRSARMAA